MKLAITALGADPEDFITEILTVISECQCNILILRNSYLGVSAIAAYFLVEGNWNYVAKLEQLLVGLHKRLGIQIQTLHTEVEAGTDKDYIPYRLETISIDQACIIQDLVVFLTSQQVIIRDIQANCFPAVYTQTPVFNTKFMVLIPASIQLLSFREAILNFCDSSNLDVILEPIKSL